MFTKVYSAANFGLDAIPIEVEVDVVDRGLPAYTIVGLPDKAVEEAKERVRSAIFNSGAYFPGHKVIINLAPADIPKEGCIYDLPIAVGILVASGQINANIKDSLFFGELSLDGSLRRIPGVLSMSLLAKKKHLTNIFLPIKNSTEASIVTGVNIFPVNKIRDIINHLSGFAKITPVPPKNFLEFYEKPPPPEIDFSEILGQEHAKRALKIAACGGHNILLKGPPGAGKTMLARAFAGILPRLTFSESLEVSKIYSLCGLLPEDKALITTRPFRSPHHTISSVGLIGGGQNPKPGEISLSHRGVLFLDEFPEFPRSVLEALRQPLEDGVVTVSRAKASLTYPARFSLVAASNPCPCGYLGSNQKPCVCSPSQIIHYQKRVSGPILDRIDIHIEVPAVKVDKFTNKVRSEDSDKIQQQVQKARDLQSKRFSGLNITCNAEMSTSQVKEFCKLSDDCLDLLRLAVSKMNLSARSYYRVIKISRTIADLENSPEIKSSYIAEALQYRPKTQDLY